MVHLIGGGKTSYNLYRVLKKAGINVSVYYFKAEYVTTRDIGLCFHKEWKGVNSIASIDKVIVTSETAFNNLNDDDRFFFKLNYFLRNKSSIESIAKKTGINSIKSFSYDHNEFDFPIIIKPKNPASAQVPFKVKIVRNKKELNKFDNIKGDCIFQKYLEPNRHLQISVAGYYMGKKESLITVKQLNQYPHGISSYVVHEKKDLYGLRKKVSNYLNFLDYKGFIEFEFIVSKNCDEVYLIDVNSRTWGWFYFYLDGLKNLSEVIINYEEPKLILKKEWVNFPRLVLSNLHGRIVNPSIKDFILKEICYEPFF